MELDFGKSNVSGTLLLNNNEGFRHCLRANSFTAPKTRVPVLRWLIGNVAIHMPCQKANCSSEISRKHAVICSGAHDELSTRYPSEAYDYQQLLAQDPTNRSTLIDLLLNKHRFKPPANLYEDVASAISMIYERCLNYQQNANGFFEPRAQSEPPTEEHETASIRRPG